MIYLYDYKSYIYDSSQISTPMVADYIRGLNTFLNDEILAETGYTSVVESPLGQGGPICCVIYKNNAKLLSIGLSKSSAPSPAPSEGAWYGCFLAGIMPLSYVEQSGGAYVLMGNPQASCTIDQYVMGDTVTVNESGMPTSRTVTDRLVIVQADKIGDTLSLSVMLSNTLYANGVENKIMLPTHVTLCGENVIVYTPDVYLMQEYDKIMINGATTTTETFSPNPSVQMESDDRPIQLIPLQTSNGTVLPGMYTYDKVCLDFKCNTFGAYPYMQNNNVKNVCSGTGFVKNALVYGGDTYSAKRYITKYTENNILLRTNSFPILIQN